MRRIVLVIVLSVFVLASCKKSNKVEQLEFEQYEYTKSSSLMCDSVSCAEIDLTIPMVTNQKSEIATKINKNNLLLIANIASIGDSVQQVSDYNTLVDNYIKDYENFVKKYPDEDLPWKAEVEGDITFSHKNLLSFEFEYYTFTGGAYGFKNKVSKNYNPQTGNVYSVEDIIKDWPELQKMLFEQVKTKYDLLSSAGELEYPESIFFYEDTIAFLYNTFDYATFNDGPVKLEYPKKDILPFLNITLEEKVATANN